MAKEQIAARETRPLDESLSYGLMIGEGISESAVSLAATTIRRRIKRNAVRLHNLGFFPKETVFRDGEKIQMEIIRIDMVSAFITPEGEVLTFPRLPSNPIYPTADSPEPVGDLEILNGVGKMCNDKLTEIFKNVQRARIATILRRLEDKSVEAGGLDDSDHEKTIKQVLRLKKKRHLKR